MKYKTIVLSSSDIEKITVKVGLEKVMDTLIDRLEKAFKAYNPKQIQIPVRSGFHYKEPELGLIEWMPLFDYGKQVVIKIVGYHPENPDKFQLPTILSTISSYDTTTGHLKGIMDGVFLTALRTGAASAVASRYLAKPESKVLGLIGCGAQAVTQLHALSRIFDLEQVLYYDIDPDTSNTFTNRTAMLNLNITYQATDMEQIVEQSDILCTLTSIGIGEGPLFRNIPTKDWLHINAVGSDFPGKTELPKELLNNSFVCPDFRQQAVIEGECQQLEPQNIGPEFFEYIQQTAEHEKRINQRSVFDSTGLALEDQVIMDLFMEYAGNLGLGQEIEIEQLPVDAKSPYEFLTVAAEVPVNEPS